MSFRYELLDYIMYEFHFEVANEIVYNNYYNET